MTIYRIYVSITKYLNLDTVPRQSKEINIDICYKLSLQDAISVANEYISNSFKSKDKQLYKSDSGYCFAQDDDIEEPRMIIIGPINVD